MTINKFPISGGVLTSATTWINNNNATVLRQSGRNLIRQLEDRAVDFSADGGEWAEAYTSTAGRLSSVDTVESDAFFDTNKYAATGNTTNDYTTYDPDSLTNPENAFDDDSDTYASFTASEFNARAYTKQIGKTFSSRNIGKVYVKAYASAQSTDGYITETQLYLDYYDGTTWTELLTLATASGTGARSVLYDDYINVNMSCQGLRVRGYTYKNNVGVAYASNFFVYKINIFTSVEKTVHHNIPTGTYKDTISTCIGVPKVVDYEDGADVQYKLTNATEDSGWLDSNKIESFTAFTSEPTKCIVKLIPKSTSPTVGYPSISGFSVVE